MYRDSPAARMARMTRIARRTRMTRTAHPMHPWPPGRPRRLLRFALWLSAAILSALVALLAFSPTHAQTSHATSPAHGAVNVEADMPMPDFLALLQQIAPAASEGAKVYLAGHRLRCGRALSTAELRRALAQEGGDPVLMGLIRNSQQQDPVARHQLVRQIHCRPGGTR